ncbi:MAG: hypothetical protein C0469_07305 [Cyanobacteria bacterium DS2.3.42]|nr:hypothetical protein [Cyanobacteria bacterium DS2.3.42]
MISRISKLNSLIAVLVAFSFAATLSGCQKVSVSRVSSKFGNVDQMCSEFVSHYLDSDSKTYASSQAKLRQDATPSLIKTMKNAGVLAKNDKELKVKTAQLAKIKVKPTVEIQKVEEGDLAPGGLIQATVTGEIKKGERPESFAYKLTLGLRKDTGKLVVVTITKL